MTRTRYGDSPWVSDVPKRRRPDFPRYRGTETYPAVIVGGGLSGCLTAYAFAAAGIKVALFEADRLGLAGASRGPGVLRGEATASYRDIESRYGRRAARAMFDSSRRAVLDLATTARRLGVKGGVEVVPALRVLASYDADEKALLKDVTMRRDAGLDAVIAEGCRGGARIEGGQRSGRRETARLGSGQSVRAGQRVWRGRGRARCGDLRAVDRETHSRAASRRRDSGRRGRRRLRRQ